MQIVLLLVLLLAACKRPDPAPDIADAAATGACRSLLFEGQRFTICRDPEARLELALDDARDRPLRSFVALEQVVGPRAAKVRFAMNAGMFDEEGRPIGLAIAEGREMRSINRRTDGGGNFHLQPNGVFLVRDDGAAEVVTTADFQPSPDIRWATQSGPMLVIDGKLNPRFDADGRSRYVRNGVGVDAGGVAVFAISDAPVSFGKFARLFAGPLGCRNALYLDGAVSSLWDPANYRMDGLVPIGPMIVAIAP
ncbi:phosphodiester glycosidase family protein [Sphingomonas glaciei]|uniref:Phosphodiester glycosidase family protein n=1 Tax=Sphingomonas glaciei TaxID=2938948 RepID=A0ABY5MWH6_9SPHN|nr:phosphodiester glycosidase family protein [Sphingomonas glaciei]UUR08618.1 phosphodiester glycosidase family protein [Sphingomonas glaciei]